ncbi:electron transporter RnfD [Mucilaginibacter sp. PAMC 26640]|nr:electron transporter RnfD [Mucilaginibacter sp. PAMC 26640]
MSRLLAFGLVILLSANVCKSIAQTDVNYRDKQIHYMGRVAYRDSAAVLTWSASSVVILFDGTGAKATLQDESGYDYVTVLVDDKVVNTIRPETIKKEYNLISGLPSGPHKLELFKRTEYDMGRLLFYKFTLDGTSKLLPPPVYKHRIEFYGNSITCGYAIEDLEKKDRGTFEFENGFKSYATITARHFNSDLSIIAKSGIGITVSWFNYVMPDIYNLTDAKLPASFWDFTQYTPEVVVVNLFQNDSWIVRQPENEQFKARFGGKAPDPDFIINAYQNFIGNIRSKYPSATIICALGSMDATKKGSAWPGYIKKAVSDLKDKKVVTCFFTYKDTSGHPSAEEQQIMADQLISFIHKKMNW